MSVPVTTYVDNAPTPAPLSTVGFKISKPGYDANTASGANMIFDSSWPSLSILLEVTVASTFGSSSTKITIPHNLGYAPFAMAWAYGPDPDGSGRTGTSTRFIPCSDRTNIYILSTSGPHLSVASKITVLVYNLDLSTDIDYTLAPGATFNMPYDKNYGIKVIKPGKSITSTDLRDYSVHSRTQSPLIKSVKTEATVNHANDVSTGSPTSTIQYTNQTKTAVWVYGFIRAGTSGLAASYGVPAGTYCPAPYYSQSYPRVFTDGITSYISYLTGTFADLGATLVILRDPMFAPNQVTVQY